MREKGRWCVWSRGVALSALGCSGQDQNRKPSSELATSRSGAQLTSVNVLSRHMHFLSVLPAAHVCRLHCLVLKQFSCKAQQEAHRQDPLSPTVHTKAT
ncbi:uncharacterized protein CC84DRAFT_912486 [Paraphaeosphaeria sporulosa]|uniref:Uncharacterized protein n=1 Tax=Paraphaeosphaeria sporulosa TaxID=1460663 RepID=A0A177C4U4_9PLEO|nr:uncharacterized protein CC84DRAFT_912486 [Paraphaeosphaeria sporulosa]OAG02754.1 hypothetical protein CC84DRAFT_912486 [Paraphaeosphaeria sporulosa]